MDACIVLHRVSGGSLLQLRNPFPLLSIFHDFLLLLSRCRCCLISLPFVSSVSYILRKSFISSSSHLSFGRPTILFVWCLVLRPGFPFSCFLLSIAHLVTMQLSLPSAISFFCAFQSSIGFLLFFILSTTIDVLLFICSIQSSSSISPVSISSSVSLEMSLSWSRSVSVFFVLQTI